MRKFLFLILLFPIQIFAQINDLSAVVSDLISLTEQYVSPAAEATTYQSSSGWYTSAKKKNLWELEMSIQGNWLLIPNNRKNTLVKEANLQNIGIQGQATTAMIPTAFGGESDVILEGSINGNTFEFDAPEGLNESYVNHYQMQASLGLWKGLSIIGRFSPKIKINDTYYQVLGAGIQYNLSQWLPKFEAKKIYLSTLFAYTSYSVSDQFKPVDLILGTINAIEVEGDSYQFSVLASKEIGNFDISASIGTNVSSFSYTINGEGDVLLSILNKSLESLTNDSMNFKADIGVNYNFKNFSVNTMVTFGEYTNALLGVNYNFFRK